ncbi:hypothetical protein ACQ4PT_061810 [Festuca glaucescens]
MEPEAGSAVAVEKAFRPLSVSPMAQRIRAADAATSVAVSEDSGNHWAMSANDEQMMGPFSVGSSVHKNVGGKGPFLHSTMVGSLEQPMDGAMGNALLDKKGEKNTVGLQGMMRNASSMKTIGESSTSFLDSSNIAMPTLSISLMENSTNIPAQPSLDDIIAFGGIPKPSTEVRSSAGL